MATPGSVHVQTAVANVLAKRPAQSAGFIADMVYPIVPVDKQANKIFTYDLYAEQFRVSDTKRGPGGEANKTDFDVDSSITYFCDDHALSSFLPQEEQANADVAIAPFASVQGKATMLQDKILLEREVNLVAAVTAQVDGSATSSPSDKWDAANGAGDPIGDLKTAIRTAFLASGAKPNRVAMDAAVLSYIGEHPDFIDRAKHTLPPSATASVGTAVLLGSLLTEDPNDPIIVVVSRAVKNTAAYKATPAFARVWSDSVLVYRYESATNGIGTSTLGIHPVWTNAQINAGGVGGVYVVSEWEQKRKSWRIDVSQYYDQIILQVNEPAAYLYTNVLNAF